MAGNGARLFTEQVKGHGEVGLFLAVLHRAIADADDPRFCFELSRWERSGGFEWVCYLAGVDPEQYRVTLIERLARTRAKHRGAPGTERVCGRTERVWDAAKGMTA